MCAWRALRARRASLPSRTLVVPTLLSVPRVPSVRRSCFRPSASTSCYPFYMRRSVTGGRSRSALLVQAGWSVALPPDLVLPVVLGRSVVFPRWSVLLVQVVRSVVLPPNPAEHVVLRRLFVLSRWSVLLVQVVRSVVLPANPVVPVVLGRSVVLRPWSVLLVQVVRSVVLPLCVLLVVQAVLSHRSVQSPLPGWSALLGAARTGCADGRAPSVLLVQAVRSAVLPPCCSCRLCGLSAPALLCRARGGWAIGRARALFGAARAGCTACRACLSFYLGMNGEAGRTWVRFVH